MLSLVGAMVAGGGWNGALAALEADAPLVVRGGSRDKPEVAWRMAWSGVETGMRTGAPQQARIARAVGEVTARPAFRADARELGTAPTATGGGPPATDLPAALLTR